MGPLFPWICSVKFMMYCDLLECLLTQINVNGTYNTCRLVASHLSKISPIGDDESAGILILVSSISYQDGQTGQTCYASTKGAVASLTLPMARDLARHKIRVVTIAPGVFESPMVAKLEKKAIQTLLAATEWPPRLGSGNDFARAVESTIENEMWNGSVLRLDGAVRLGKL
jgi:3-hydroxyacyl-CoA dehydrogenase / 3-hydroxy-2-methylbutyryl-CoA dehydrogenase